MKTYSLTIKGKNNNWSFPIYGNDSTEWEADGLDVEEIVFTCPEWAPSWLWKLLLKIHLVWL